MKELVTYYYRHFSPPAPLQGKTGPVPPVRPVVGSTARQRRATEEVLGQLRQQDKQIQLLPSASRGSRAATGGEGKKQGVWDEEREAMQAAELKPAVRRLLMTLICDDVGSGLFRSAVISYCAMHSRERVHGGGGRASQGRAARRKGTGDDDEDEAQRRRAALGVWKSPGNYTSHLPAMIWTAQLVIFESVCSQRGEQGDEVLVALEQVCQAYMHQRGETAFGHLLQWRLYLGAVARSAITHLGTTLRLDDVSRLVVSEFRRAQALLHNELLFGAHEEIGPLATWYLEDDLDGEDYGGSWVSDERNETALAGMQDALLRQIEARPDLRRVFFLPSSGCGGDGQKGENRTTPTASLCRRAMAVYEAYVQDFLQSMSTLLHVAALPPLRAPELLSITWMNGPRRRSVFIWEKLVMLHVRYHKSQRQTGDVTDNIRFLPPAIGNLLLTFLAVVQPLRQISLGNHGLPCFSVRDNARETLISSVRPATSRRSLTS